MLHMELAGPDGWPYDSEWIVADSADTHTHDVQSAAAMAGYLDYRKTTIYGGTTEVQKNIIARMVLGV